MKIQEIFERLAKKYPSFSNEALAALAAAQLQHEDLTQLRTAMTDQWEREWMSGAKG